MPAPAPRDIASAAPAAQTACAALRCAALPRGLRALSSPVFCTVAAERSRAHSTAAGPPPASPSAVAGAERLVRGRCGAYREGWLRLRPAGIALPRADGSCPPYAVVHARLVRTACLPACGPPAAAATACLQGSVAIVCAAPVFSAAVSTECARAFRLEPQWPAAAGTIRRDRTRSGSTRWLAQSPATPCAFSAPRCPTPPSAPPRPPRRRSTSRTDERLRTCCCLWASSRRR
jgi:hypothetical protein